MFEKKQILLQKVFGKAKLEIPRGTKNSVAVYLSSLFEEKFGFSKDERTYARYFKRILEENTDYDIDDITLDQLSCYVGYKNFDEFCKSESFLEENSNTVLEEILHTLVNIKDNIGFVVSRFVERRSGFGLIGLLFLGGIILNQYGIFKKEKTEIQGIVDYRQTEKNQRKENQKTESKSIIIQIPESEKRKGSIIVEKKKECMYWNGEIYIPVFCNEKIDNHDVILLNEEQLKIKRITRPDTLTVENAMGKVWYDKSNKKVEFFTHYGIHPENSKTLKPVTEYILEKY